MPAFMARSLQQAAALNSGLRYDPLRGWVVVTAAAGGGVVERVLGKSYRGQLHWGMGCGQHFKYCVAAAIHCEELQLCYFCTPDDVLRAHHKQVMSRAEHSLALQLHGAGMLAGMRYQARVVPGWQGAIDFYCPETKLCIQVDDPHHFRKSIHGQDRATILDTDVSNSVACLQAGFSMLRLSHAELVHLRVSAIGLLQEVQAIIRTHPGCRLLVLSPFYGSVRMGVLGQYGTATYVEECYWLLQGLGMCQYMAASSMQGQCYFFML